MSKDDPAIEQTILSLSSKDATLDRAGGKGANLAILTQASFDVPPGFIVRTEAYRAFVEANRIGQTLLSMAAAAMPDDPAALDYASGKIQALFKAGIMPDALAKPIRDAYAQLSRTQNPPVAVRSSATAEDLPGLSFAGQQDTYLNIVGAEELIKAVQACWGSLWTARAMGYRARNHIPAEDVALAVVVQMMIPSEVSGILFTANPLTGHRGEMAIDASFGLGEAIVSGQVEPDHYVVDAQAMHIKTRKLGKKALSILPLTDGGTQSIEQERSQQQALSDAQILELARVAARVADHFGTPQDIEWAFASNKHYILQSRAITSLYPLPDNFPTSGDLKVLFSLNSLQGVIEPFTPAGQYIFVRVAAGFSRIAGTTQRPVLFVAGGRLYLDMTGLLNNPRFQKIGLNMLAYMDPGAKQAAVQLIEQGRLKMKPPSSPATLLSFMWRMRPIIKRVALAVLRPAVFRKNTIQRADRFVAKAHQDFDAASSLADRVTLIDRYGPTMLDQLIKTGLIPAAFVGVGATFLVDHWLHQWLDAEPGSVRRLLRGLPGNPTTEMDLTLWATAQAIRADATSYALFQEQEAAAIADAYLHGTLPPVTQDAIKAFLDQYGMRAVREIDLGVPRWRDDPRALIQNLASYLQISDPALAPDRLFQKARAEVEKLSADDIAQVRQRKGPIQASLLRMVLRRIEVLAGMREMPKFYIIKVLDQIRSALLRSGQQLVAQGRLDCPEDIYFVPFNTLAKAANDAALDLKAVVRQERDDYTRELARRQIPRLLLNTGEVFYEGVTDAGTNDLVGDGVSPGMVEGKVHVVEDPRGVRLEPGEILVCPATDPGWTPLFLSAGGLVMELGGMMTHGSVVAREYGIPAVVGVHDATRRLKTGQRIRVDGSLGRVVVLG